MKLHTGLSPNGLRVDVFLREKGVALPREAVDILGGATRTPAFAKINPLCEVPVLELDDGTFIAETVAICRYIEALHPAPSMFGETAKAQGVIEMWNRRVELRVFNALGAYVQHTHPFFADKVEQIPAYAESQLRLFEKTWAWLDGQLADGRPFIAGDAFSVADITAAAVVMICGMFDLPRPDSLTYAKRWERSVMARESIAGAMPKAA